MSFSDLFFLYAFLPLCLIVYFISPKIKYKNTVLVIFSLIFYAWGDIKALFVITIYALINFALGRLIKKNIGEKKAKIFVTIGLFLDLGILLVFKYTGFVLENINGIFRTSISVPNFWVPLGLSFFTFRTISYLLDVYWEKIEAETYFPDFLLFTSLFPCTIAGPIVRYSSIGAELKDRTVNVDDMYQGFTRLCVGLAKKVLIADNLITIVNAYWSVDAGAVASVDTWYAVIVYSMYVYFDFSGYSDMAIGIGRCLGFHFRENFDHPYCCNSITDFWRRWHISLGSFFRDYLYIPLGGNRHHQFLNILIVWFLTGLWHGASWNFVFWGLYFGLIVAIEKFTVLRWKVPAPVAHLYSLILVILGWGIFYFTDFSRMTDFFPVLFGKAVAATDFTVRSALTSRFWLWIAAIVCCLPLGRWIGGWFEKRAIGHNVLHILQTVFAVAVLAVSVALLVGGTSNPFIYTRF